MESRLIQATDTDRLPFEQLRGLVKRHSSMLIFVTSCAWLFALEALLKQRAIRGVLFQAWSSDVMMQTLPAEILRRAPWRALYYLHIQPPMFDGLRALLAQIVPRENLADHVDNALYAVYVVVFGLIAMRLQQWTERLSDARCAFAVWLLWLAYPATMFTATLLESTFLSTFLAFFFAYELWRLRRPDGSIWRLTFFAVCIFFTRTVFQWYTFAIVAVLLVLQGASPRQLLIFLGLSGLFVAPYLAKQKVLFDTISTTSFSGYHAAGVIWYRPTDFEVAETKRTLDYHYPEGAREVQGTRSSAMYNNEANVIDNLVYSRLAARYGRLHPRQASEGLLRSFKQNFEIFWQPTTSYSANRLVDKLPWKHAFDRIFSGWTYMSLLGAAGLCWAVQWREKYRRLRPEPWQVLRQLGFEISIFTFALFVFATTCLGNRYDWVEAQRLKFVLEPMFFVFFGTQLYWGMRRACCLFTRH